LRDIEELAFGSACKVLDSPCLGMCGKGPNVDVEIKKNKPKTFNGINSYKKILDLVKSESKGGVAVNELVETLGELKYNCRREKDYEKKLSILDQAFAHLGGEVAEAQKKYPALFGQLLLIRSKAYLEKTPGSALTDAKLALQLMPKNTQAHLLLADAYEVSHFAAEAIKAVEAVMDAEGVHKAILASIRGLCRVRVGR